MPTDPTASHAGVKTLAALVIAASTAACSTEVVDVKPLGEQGGKLWVYVETDDDDESGVFACETIGEIAKCTRAEITPALPKDVLSQMIDWGAGLSTDEPPPPE